MFLNMKFHKDIYNKLTILRTRIKLASKWFGTAKRNHPIGWFFVWWEKRSIGEALVRRSSRKAAIGFSNCEVSSKVFFSQPFGTVEKITDGEYTSQNLWFCVCVRRTQHRLTACGQHHFVRSTNIIPQQRTQNGVATSRKQCYASHKQCCLRQTMLRSAQIYVIIRSEVIGNSEEVRSRVHQRHNITEKSGKMPSKIIPKLYA